MRYVFVLPPYKIGRHEGKNIKGDDKSSPFLFIKTNPPLNGVERGILLDLFSCGV